MNARNDFGRLPEVSAPVINRVHQRDLRRRKSLPQGPRGTGPVINRVHGLGLAPAPEHGFHLDSGPDIALCTHLEKPLSIARKIDLLGRMLEPEAWAPEHFGKTQLGDVRRTARLIRMATAAASSSGGTVTSVFHGEAGRQGAYDFLERPHVKADALERGIGELIGAKCAEQGSAIVVLDGSHLSHSDFFGKRKLGRAGNYRADGKGLSVMIALAFSAEGGPIGPLSQAMWSRPLERPKGRRERIHAIPVEEKETWRWIEGIEASVKRAVKGTEQCLTFVLDRQADTDAVVCTLARSGQRFVLRGRNRVGFVGTRRATIRQHIAVRPILGTYTLAIADRDGRAGRSATMSVRTVDVEFRIKDPLTNEPYALTLTVVNARETSEPPPDESASIGYW